MVFPVETVELRKKAGKHLVDEEYQTARTMYAELSRLCPEDSDVWRNLGWINIKQGNIQEAVSSYRNAVKTNPSSINAQFGLATALEMAGSVSLAKSQLCTLLKIDPTHIDAAVNLSSIEYTQGKFKEALLVLRSALQTSPENVKLNIALGIVYSSMNELQKATNCLKKALRLEPDNKEALSHLASVYAYKGDAKQAYQVLSPVLKSKQPGRSAAITFSNICRPLNRCHEAIKILEDLLPEQNKPEDESGIRFSLGKLYDYMEDYDKAFDNYRVGNKLTDFSYDPWEEKRWNDEITERLDVEYFRNAQHARNLSKKLRPVFIISMPRSGSTLVEQILSSHPSVYSVGEYMGIPDIANTICNEYESINPYPFCLKDIHQVDINSFAKSYLKGVAKKESKGESIVIDKMPDNYKNLGLIQLLFPKVKVIHCVREPMDTCLSCYTNKMGYPYSYDLTNLGRHYRLYERLMQHWKNVLSISILDVHYEDMVEDPERISRSIIEFCGLKWSNRCLEFHKSGRSVVTSSAYQVRQPVYKRSVARWKYYEKHLQELRTALEQRL